MKQVYKTEHIFIFTTLFLKNIYILLQSYTSL